jgi:hypothetical protein
MYGLNRRSRDFARWIAPNMPYSENGATASRKDRCRFRRSENDIPRARPVPGVDIEITAEFGVFGFRISQRAEMFFDIRQRAEKPLFFAAPERDANGAALVSIRWFL